MTQKVLRALSMKSKAALAVSIMFLLFISVLAVLSLRYFEERFEDTVYKQQIALAKSVAQAVDSRLLLAKDALETLARDMPADVLRDPEKAQSFLNQQRALLGIFDNGLLLISKEGRVHAEAPFISGGRGRDVSRVDVFKGVSETQKPYISRPFASVRAQGRPAMSIGIPLFDRQGNMIGRLHGSLELQGRNFLADLIDLKIGEGGYLFMSTTDRMLILHPNRSRIMTPGPGPGQNLVYDRAMVEISGSGRTVTSFGQRNLLTFQRIPSTDWVLGVNFPEDEAYAPFYAAQKVFILLVTLGTAAFLLMVWWLMRYLTKPLTSMTQHVASLADKQGEERFLRLRSNDEIGTLGQAFDQMLLQLDAEKQKLRDSAVLLNEAQHMAHVGSWELDLITGELHWSNEIYRLFEIDKNKFDATYEAFLDAIHPEDREAVNQAYTNSLKDRRPYVISHRLLMSDGRIKYVEERCYSDFDTQGNPVRSVGTVQDITEIKLAEEAIQKLNLELEQRVQTRTLDLQLANEKIQHSFEALSNAQSHLVQSEKMAALGGLVAGVAHEINTPIGIGVTAASLLEDEVKKLGRNYQSGALGRKEMERFIATATDASGIVLSNLERAAELIGSFKLVAVDQSDGQHREFQLHGYLKDVIRSLSPQLTRHSHQVSLSCPEDLVLYANPGDYSHIFTNLVLNSIVHGFEGAQSGHIGIEVTTTQDEMLIRYTDDGRGIAPEHLGRIFDPFFTTKRGQGGSGLGLHVTYNIVTQGLGGHINCRSEKGRGVVFEIRIPLAATKAGAHWTHEA